MKTREEYIAMLEDYVPDLAPQEKFDKDWFVADLDLILSGIKYNQRKTENEIESWLDFLQGCKDGRYL